MRMKRAMRAAFAVLVLAVGMVVGDRPAGATWEQGVAAFQRGEYEAAFFHWLPVAEFGEPEAQFNLGLMYQEGRGVARHPRRAIWWFERAARQGHAEAQLNLCFMFAQGQGLLRPDLVQAHAWCNIAAGRFPVGARRDLAVAARNELAAEMSADDLTDARRRAFNWVPTPED